MRVFYSQFTLITEFPHTKMLYPMIDDFRRNDGRGVEKAFKSSRELLSNFPEELFINWIDVLIRQRGEVKESKEWRRTFMLQPISVVKRWSWCKKRLPLSREMFCDASLSVIDDIYKDVFDNNRQNKKYPRLNSRERVDSINQYLNEHSVLPGTLIALKFDDGLIVVDGIHRLVASFRRLIEQEKNKLVVGDLWIADCSASRDMVE